jgi:hypothetical protein
MTAQEALAKWDAGEILWSIEMGGMGPGYEQAIQCAIFEMIRDAEPVPNKGEEWGAWGDAAARRVGGMSGAQFNAARAVAIRALVKGWTATVESVPLDRRIQVSRNWTEATHV